jgi:Protein of unknown function (DUF3300)
MADQQSKNHTEQAVIAGGERSGEPRPLCQILLLVGCIISLISAVPFIAMAQPIPASTALTNQQLDQLTAPVALYADPLVGMILIASTYPLEIVEAERWLQDPVNATIKGAELANALRQESWDPSVKSLVAFPQILEAMNDDMEWTERIGDAFLAQQNAVMDSIQRLRQRAATDGVLKSTPQQTVSTEDKNIAIEPADPMTVYVPYYDPTVVYGEWPWAEYPPVYFVPPVDVIIGAGVVIYFGAGDLIVGPLWGWNHWDWRNHRLDIVPGPFGAGPTPLRSGSWEHDPAHRRGVPYGNAILAARYEKESEASRREFSGFSGLSATSRVPVVSHQAPEASPREAPMRTAQAGVHRATPAPRSLSEHVRGTHGQAARGGTGRPTPASGSSSGSHGNEPPHH